MEEGPRDEMCLVLITHPFASHVCAHISTHRATGPPHLIDPRQGCCGQCNRQHHVLLFLSVSVLTSELHVVLSNTGRPGLETSAQQGVFFSEDGVELTGRESWQCVRMYLQTENTRNCSFKAEKTPWSSLSNLRVRKSVFP